MIQANVINYPQLVRVVVETQIVQAMLAILILMGVENFALLQILFVYMIIMKMGLLSIKDQMVMNNVVVMDSKDAIVDLGVDTITVTQDVVVALLI
jgi:hypothetical protein